MRTERSRRPTGTAAAFLLRYALMTIVIVAIAYGSLYPFSFEAAGTFTADIRHFAGTWNMPTERGDVLANLLLYAPLGLTVALAFSRGRPRYVSIAIATFVGASLSLAIELTQYYDLGRVSALSDFYLNAIGTLAGAILAQATNFNLVKTSWPSDASSIFARLLLLAWIVWRFYPYVPTIDLHKYWHSVRAAFAPDVTAYAVFRYTIIWLSVAFLVQVGLRPRRLTQLTLLVIVGYFSAKVLVIDQFLSLPEILAAAISVPIGYFLLQRHRSVGVACLAALAMLIMTLSRVLPWQFVVAQRAFQWIPFFSYLHGSLHVNVISFAEKFYVYGVTLLLLKTAGMPLRIAVALEFVILLSTSVLETFMPRSAEISDALLALVLGGLFALLQRRYSEECVTAPKALPART